MGATGQAARPGPPSDLASRVWGRGLGQATSQRISALTLTQQVPGKAMPPTLRFARSGLSSPRRISGLKARCQRGTGAPFSKVGAIWGLSRNGQPSESTLNGNWRPNGSASQPWDPQAARGQTASSGPRSGGHRQAPSRLSFQAGGMRSRHAAMCIGANQRFARRWCQQAKQPFHLTCHPASEIQPGPRRRPAHATAAGRAAGISQGLACGRPNGAGPFHSSAHSRQHASGEWRQGPRKELLVATVSLGH